MRKKISNDYNLRLEYEIGCKNPGHLFISMSNAIEAFKKADIMLARSINQVISSDQTLEGLELGSIFTKIRQAFEYEETETLDDMNSMETPIQDYFEKGKKALIDEINIKKDFSKIEDIDYVINKINDVAKETGVSDFFNYCKRQFPRPLNLIFMISFRFTFQGSIFSPSISPVIKAA